MVAAPTDYYDTATIIEQCPAEKPIHFMAMVVGYGKKNDIDIWKIRGTHGDSFNEAGYYYMKRGLRFCSSSITAYDLSL